jgi:hypothetical protein
MPKKSPTSTPTPAPTTAQREAPNAFAPSTPAIQSTATMRIPPLACCAVAPASASNERHGQLR